MFPYTVAAALVVVRHERERESVGVRLGVVVGPRGWPRPREQDDDHSIAVVFAYCYSNDRRRDPIPPWSSWWCCVFVGGGEKEKRTLQKEIEQIVALTLDDEKGEEWLEHILGVVDVNGDYV